MFDVLCFFIIFSFPSSGLGMQVWQSCLLAVAQEAGEALSETSDSHPASPFRKGGLRGIFPGTHL